MREVIKAVIQDPYPLAKGIQVIDKAETLASRSSR